MVLEFYRIVKVSIVVRLGADPNLAARLDLPLSPPLPRVSREMIVVSFVSLSTAVLFFHSYEV